MRKCKRCGRYFIMKGNYDPNYCTRILDGQTRPCQELAAQENYKAKANENPALRIYSKYYKRYAARVRSKQLKEKEFKTWKYKALTMRDECTDGNITAEIVTNYPFEDGFEVTHIVTNVQVSHWMDFNCFCKRQVTFNSFHNDHLLICIQKAPLT